MNRTLKPTHLPVQTYAVDLAKNVFQVHGYRASRERVLQRRLSRGQFDKFLSGGQALVVMEACGSSQHWSRTLQARGYRTKLVPPQFVAQHRHGTKNDSHDADAIYAAHHDPRVRSVPTKTLAEQDLCAVHRVRALLIKQQTACSNQIRGLLAERGVVAAQGSAGAKALRALATEGRSGEVTPALAELIAQISRHLDQIDAHLTQIERQLRQQRKTSAVAQRLDGVFGVGLITATALAGEFGQGVDRFADSRQFAASFGATPSEHSSGEKRRLGGITRRGNAYLRRLLVQGAQAIVQHRARHPEDALCQLAERLLQQGKRHNVVVVALANRLARVCYAVLKHGEDYRPAGWRGRDSASSSPLTEAIRPNASKRRIRPELSVSATCRRQGFAHAASRP